MSYHFLAFPSVTYVPDLEGDIIQIQAGERNFQVHEGVLRQSLFFVNALKPEWVSARNGKPIDLSNEDATTFATYQQYLYSHQIKTTFDIPKLCKMYILGEMLMDLEFQDAILGVVMDGYQATGRLPEPEEICIIYEGTPENSLARVFIADLIAQREDGLEVMKNKEFLNKVPADFTKDLLMVVMQHKIKITPMLPWIVKGDRSMYFVGARKKAADNKEDDEMSMGPMYSETW